MIREEPFHIEKILSGGQTVADRAALDVALELGNPCGGWSPISANPQRNLEKDLIPYEVPA